MLPASIDTARVDRLLAPERPLSHQPGELMPYPTHGFPSAQALQPLSPAKARTCHFPRSPTVGFAGHRHVSELVNFSSSLSVPIPPATVRMTLLASPPCHLCLCSSSVMLGVWTTGFPSFSAAGWMSPLFQHLSFPQPCGWRILVSYVSPGKR